MTGHMSLDPPGTVTEIAKKVSIGVMSKSRMRTGELLSGVKAIFIRLITARGRLLNVNSLNGDANARRPCEE